MFDAVATIVVVRARGSADAASNAIPVAKPWLGRREERAARRAIASGWVMQGPETAAFEREFAAAVGADRAVAVSNCTTGLHLALQVLGIQPGVAVPKLYIGGGAKGRRQRVEHGRIPAFGHVGHALEPARRRAHYQGRFWVPRKKSSSSMAAAFAWPGRSPSEAKLRGNSVRCT